MTFVNDPDIQSSIPHLPEKKGFDGVKFTSEELGNLLEQYFNQILANQEINCLLCIRNFLHKIDSSEHGNVNGKSHHEAANSKMSFKEFVNRKQTFLDSKNLVRQAYNYSDEFNSGEDNYKVSSTT